MKSVVNGIVNLFDQTNLCSIDYIIINWVRCSEK